MEEIQPEIVEEATPTQEEPIKTQEPIKDVNTFWQRLDEVLQLVKSGGTVNNKLESILETFEETTQINQTPYRSFIFQPERMSISSNDDVLPSNQVSLNDLDNGGHQQAETFSQFRIRFAKSLVNVKSIQLLSAVIPNATQNIPDDQCIFYYYRLRNLITANLGAWAAPTIYFPGDIVTLGGNTYACITDSQGINPSVTYWAITSQKATTAWNIATAYVPGNLVLYNGFSYICITANTQITPGVIYWTQFTLPVDTTRPNYYDLNPYRIEIVSLKPTFGYPYEFTGDALLYNRTFQDYNDLLTTLNACANNAQTASIPGDVVFLFNNTLNKFQVQGTETANGYFYLPCGYEDKNIDTLMTSINYTAGNEGTSALLLGYDSNLIYSPNYTLNLRLGFTWNGIFLNPSAINPYTDTSLAQNVYWYMRSQDPIYGPNLWTPNLLTANSYCDLVNTSCVRIYCDTTFGSTQDGVGNGGLLSIVPVNTTNLGVAFYQNNFNNPLTKIPKIIPEMNIRLINDQGLPYYLPNSATVTLEIAMEYY